MNTSAWHLSLWLLLIRNVTIATTKMWYCWAGPQQNLMNASTIPLNLQNCELNESLSFTIRLTQAFHYIIKKLTSTSIIYHSERTELFLLVHFIWQCAKSLLLRSFPCCLILPRFTATQYCKIQNFLSQGPEPFHFGLGHIFHHHRIPLSENHQ